MNGNGGRYGTETLEDILGELEALEWDETDESEERVGRRGRPFGRRPPPRTAPGTGLATPRPAGTTQFVTQGQLQTALAKVGAQIKTNSDAIKTVSDRVSTQADLLGKEVIARKKKTDELEKGLRQTRELTAILPLLSRPKSVQLADTAIVGQGPAPKALVDSDDTLSFILPLMLLGGSGSGGGGGMFGGGGSGGDDNSMMMLVLALTLSGRK